jgi:hypothetical protein
MDVGREIIRFGPQSAVLATPLIAYVQDVMRVREKSLNWALLLAFGVLA